MKLEVVKSCVVSEKISTTTKHFSKVFILMATLKDLVNGIKRDIFLVRHSLIIKQYHKEKLQWLSIEWSLFRNSSSE